MRIEDITVEVRDGQLNKVGQLSGSELVGSTFVLRHNEVGSWQVTVPGDSVMGELLRTPKYGIVVTGPNGVIFSGPTMGVTLNQTEDDPDGTWTITGVDDSVILQERLAYPLPSEDDVTLQTESNDIRSGNAETVIKGYVDDNLINGPTVRKVTGLTAAANLNRGGTVRGNARFDNLQELCYGLAEAGGVGYQILQDDTDLVFNVYVPQDVSGIVRLDVENGRLNSSEYSYMAPVLTRAIVGGAGESVERLFYEGTTSDSTTAETLWGRRIEAFVDQRGSEDFDQLEQKSDEALVNDGKTRVALSVSPSDAETMRFGYEWGLGDTVAVIVKNIQATAVVYTVGLSIQSDGVYIAAEVGTPVARGYESKLQTVQQQHEARISNIERNTTGYGVTTAFNVSGGTDGTQPTFSGPVFTATYTRFGDMIHFAYSADFANITSFGTGQYFMTLPYDTARPYTFNGGSLFDAGSGTVYSIIGLVDQGSDIMTLWYIKSNGETEAFEHNKPITLTTADSFEISGTYELALSGS